MSVPVTDRPGLVLLAPITPAHGGNGLAMRVAVLLDAAAVDHDVHLVVAGVNGSTPAAPSTGATTTRTLDLTPTGDRASVMALMADPRWRARLAALAPFPPGATQAGPERAAGLAAALDDIRFDGVLACRMVLAPLGLALAEAVGVPLLVDADDDDERLLNELGDPEGAAAHGRLARVCLPEAALVLTAAAGDAAALAARHDLGNRVVVVPNPAPLPPVPAPDPPPGNGQVLMVGNLTYAPNVIGAQWLVASVLAHLPAPMTIDLVGDAAPEVRALAGPRVRVHGWVEDVAPLYAASDVAVAPLRHGAGTRIKVLEAFAHRRPVVATTVAADGLEVTDGDHLRLADDAVAFAAAIVEVTRPEAGAGLVAAGAALAATTYHPDLVGRRAAGLMARVTDQRERP